MIKLSIIGCGVVGQGLLTILRDKKLELKKTYGFEVMVESISDKFKGAIMDTEGLDIDKVLNILSLGNTLEQYNVSGREITRGLDPLETIRIGKSNIIAEMSFTDIKTAEPATTYIREALKLGKHVVTSNKGPAALHYYDLINMAKQNGVDFRIEGTVMSGTPVFTLCDFALAANKIIGVRGILNGTTNFILTKMELEDMQYENALRMAQEKGYAEADPTADVQGFDALAKVVILSNSLLGANLKPSEIPCKGITDISLANIKDAQKQSMRYKLIGSTKWENGKVVASVQPMMLPLADPLASVAGAKNALTFETDLMGSITIQGAGAGKIETGYSILADLLTIHRRYSR